MSYVAVATDSHGRTHGKWEGQNPEAVMQRAEQEAHPQHSLVVRSDRTSDGTIWGLGKGRIIALREPGKTWVRF